MKTNLELNKAVHKWLGKCWHEFKQPSDFRLLRYSCKHCPESREWNADLRNPSYCNDHKAVREFLKAAIDEVGEQIVSNYMPDVDGDSYEIDMLRSAMLPIRELAEIGAKAVGIWVD